MPRKPALPALIRKATETDVTPLDDRTLRFTISTATVDREKDTIAVDGWKLDGYLKNPVVLWGHDYTQLPVAKALEVKADGDRLVATAQFPPADVHPFADTVYQLLKGGYLRGTSVGFKPLKYVRNEDRGGLDFTQQELLEFSIVPIPANPQALMEARGAKIDLAPLREWAETIIKGLPDSEPDPAAVADEDLSVKGVVPSNISTALAAESAAWARPTLMDFTDKGWGDLTDAERRSIAEHFAWASELPPASFGSLKLPHHNPSDGKVNWEGLVLAIGRLGQTQMPDADLAPVKAHLTAHYRAFKPDGELPASLKAAASDQAPEVLVLHDDPPQVEKAGRVLSAANETALRGAVTAIETAVEQLQAVLAQVDPSAPAEPAEPADQQEQAAPGQTKATPAGATEAEPFWLELAADPVVIDLSDAPTFDAAVLRGALAETVRSVVAELVQVRVDRALNALRGRID